MREKTPPKNSAKKKTAIKVIIKEILNDLAPEKTPSLKEGLTWEADNKKRRAWAEARISSMKPLLLKALPFLGVALATTPAWAGWSAAFEYDGKSVSGPINNPWAYSDENGSSAQGIGATSVQFGKSQDGTSSGHYILELRLPVSEKLPPTVGVAFRQRAAGSGARADVSGGPTSYYSVNPEPGGTPGKVTLSTKVTMPDGTSYTDTEHMSHVGKDYIYTSGGWGPTALVTISTSSATKENGYYVVRYPLPYVEAKFTVTQGSYVYKWDPGTGEPGGDGTQASVDVDVQVGSDSRTVWLTRRSGSDTTRYVDSSGMWITERDTTYSYRAYDLYPTGAKDFLGNPQKTLEWRDQNNRQIIICNPNPLGSWTQAPIVTPSGSTIPARSWKWTPDNDPSVTQDLSGASANYQVMPKGAYEKFYGDWRASTGGAGAPSPTFTFDYELTDNKDGAKAEARYILHLHHEWENWRPNADNPSNIQQAQFPPGPAIGNVWVQCDPTETQPTQATFNGTIGTDIGTSVGVSGGFSIADFLNFGVDVGKSWSKSYGKEFAATKMVAPSKHRYAFVQLNWFRYHDLVDHYTPSGRDANPARPDGAYIQSHDDLKEGNVGVTFDWSAELDYRDFTGSGAPTP